MIKKLYIYVYVYWSSGKVPIILDRSVMKLEFPELILEEYSNVKFHENPSSGSRVVHYGQTESRM